MTSRHHPQCPPNVAPALPEKNSRNPATAQQTIREQGYTQNYHPRLRQALRKCIHRSLHFCGIQQPVFLRRLSGSTSTSRHQHTAQVTRNELASAFRIASVAGTNAVGVAESISGLSAVSTTAGTCELAQQQQATT